MGIDLEAGGMGSVLPKLEGMLNEYYKLQTICKMDLEHLSTLLRRIYTAIREVPATGQLDAQFWFWWAKQASDLSFRVEDAVDTYLLRVNGFEPAVSKPDGFRLLVKKKNPDQQFADAVREIKVQLEDLAKPWIDGAVDIPAPATTTVGPDPPVADVEQMVGIPDPEATQELIIKMRISGSDDVCTSTTKKLKILSIVGFEGVGKTALAQTVYDTLRPQFDCGAFVSLPHRNLDACCKDAFEGIALQLGVVSFINNNEEAKDLTLLVGAIREFLHNKRYIIVVDNLWNAGHWRNILRSLPSNLHGSRIITTTRVNHIAKTCCSGHDELICETKNLGYQNSKRLFLKQLVGSGISCPPESDAATQVVDGILKLCDGVPSAIITVASLLASKLKATMKQETMYSLHSAWGEMMESAHADVPRLAALRTSLWLSYVHLPIHLKTCLLYLVTTASSNKKKEKIERHGLVRKWIAEGFIPQAEGSSREQVAIGYLDELISRNLIQSVEYYGSCRGEETCQVNCLMLQVIRLMSKEEEEHFVNIFPHLEPSIVFVQSSDQVSSVVREIKDKCHVRSITMTGPGKLVISVKHLEHLRVLDLDGCEDVDNSDLDDICLMFLLRYLSLRQTGVTVIPPEISNLRYLETLDVRRTRISNLPGEIGKLQNLETLDVRQTRVKELPRELAHLPKLAHLYFGQSSYIGGVKLPAGSDHQFKSVKVIGTIDSRECSESAMEEISRLPEVREIAVLLYDGPDDNERNHKLLSSISKCPNLDSLIIYGDSDPNVELPPASSNLFPLLEKLVVAGRFVKVPRWIAQLGALKKLDIRVCKLDPDHLGILGALPGLTTLALALVCIPRKKQVAITGSPECFTKLEVFSFDCRVPWITFEQSSMPRLKHLHLKLYACAAAGKLPSGITHLGSLEKIVLRYSSEYENSSGVTEEVDAMRQEADRHGNLIELSVNGDYEVFVSDTRLDKNRTSSEIEECY